MRGMRMAEKMNNSNKLFCFVTIWIKESFIKMSHTDVVASIITNRFPYFCRTSSFFDSKQSGLLLS